MRRLALFLVAFCLLAAEPWQTKPFAEWTDKDLNKILTNSPWSRPVSTELRGPIVPDGLGHDSGDTAGRPAQLGAGTGPGMMVPTGPPPGTTGRNADNLGQAGGEGRSLLLTVRWQSALPIKQALVRRKFGSEAATSPDAKKLLDDNPVYLIAISGLPPVSAAQSKSEILAQTSLSSKSKDLRPSDAIFAQPGKNTETIFVFQKTTAFTSEDKDVEFATRVGTLDVKCKFRLKDMLFNGALSL